MQFRIVTYNMHKGIGGIDRKYRLERIVEVLDRYDADLVLLQEVDDGVPRSRRDRQVEMLAGELGYRHHAYQRNVHLKAGHYGNAILSRHPLTHLEDVDLTIRFKKRRRAQVVRCHFKSAGHSHSLLVANVHLGLASIERQYQLKHLLANHHLVAAHHTTPIIVGGDFNDIWATLYRRVLHSAGFACAGRKIRTFPAAMPVRSLDYLYFRGPLVVNSAFAGHTNVARRASDHLPLVADFEWRL